jgi:hypothetical protein
MLYYFIEKVVAKCLIGSSLLEYACGVTAGELPRAMAYSNASYCSCIMHP